MLCSIGIQRTAAAICLASAHSIHCLDPSLNSASNRQVLIPREKSQPSRGIVRIMHFVSHKSHYHIFSGIHRSKIHQISLTREPHSVLPQLAPMYIRLHD